MHAINLRRLMCTALTLGFDLFFNEAADLGLLGICFDFTASTFFSIGGILSLRMSVMKFSSSGNSVTKGQALVVKQRRLA
jgi:hypothetical protein